MHLRASDSCKRFIISFTFTGASEVVGHSKAFNLRLVKYNNVVGIPN